MHAISRLLVFAVLAAVLAAPPMAAGAAPPAVIHVCSGYGCAYRTRLVVTDAMQRRLAAIMRHGRGSAGAERAAIGRAVQHFERQATKVVGVADEPKGDFNGGRVYGQMDCIDESTNTRNLLKLIESMGLLRYHDVEANGSRGFFLDRRYPHATAVIGERGGTRWAVDSWYEPAGGPPDIMPLEEWRKRGVRGER